MERTIIKIDEIRCNGCGICITGCHEGALQLIDGKARIVSEFFCDGLGACIGECPVGAITLEKRVALPYDERAVLERIIPQGEKILAAHLIHLKEHNEIEYLRQGLDYLKENNIKIPLLDAKKIGGITTSIKPLDIILDRKVDSRDKSKLTHWPIQLHLIDPGVAYFKGADLLLAADCAAFSYGDFHNRFIADKSIAIACPKLDSGKDIYLEKLISMIDNSLIKSITVVIMEVPCCRGLLQLARLAIEKAEREIELRVVVIGVKGDIIREE